jgi:hypothetical protein
MIEALKPYEGKIVYLYGIDLISDFGGGGYTPVYLENIERRKMGIFSRDWKINAKIHKINWIDKIDSVSLPYELPIIETKTSSIGIWQIAVLPDEFYNKEKFESLMKRSKIKKEEAIIIKTKI